MMEYNLLEKTEFWISPIYLTDVNLDACARVAAGVLALNPADIMVTDVLKDTMTLDVLVPTVSAESIVGCENDLLAALAALPGVQVVPETRVHSRGILGFIALDKTVGEKMLAQSVKISDKIRARIKRRCLVFSSGSELIAGQIHDTNTPFLIRALNAEDYEAFKAPTLPDCRDDIAKAFKKGADDGYGLLITTGGVGAEEKDQTIEALNLVDPRAQMPYFLKFHKGFGRHKKEGVRIGVGRLQQARIVCLPGPHDELELVWPVLKEGLKKNWDRVTLADALAQRLRRKFLARNPHHPVAHV